MEQTFWIALGASSLAALVTALGIYSVRHFEPWARANIVYFISYAAGMLVYVGATHLLPESEHQRKPYAWLAFGAGIVTAIVIVLSE